MARRAAALWCAAAVMWLSGAAAAPRDQGASSSWGVYLDAVLLLVPTAGGTPAKSTALREDLRAAVAVAVGYDGKTAPYTHGAGGVAGDPEEGVAVARLRTTPQGDGCGNLGCVEAEVHLRASGDDHGARLEMALKHSIAKGLVADGIASSGYSSVELREARVWHTSRAGAAATVGARVRLPGWSGSWGAGDELDFVTALSRSLNLHRTSAADAWATYLEAAAVVAAPAGGAGAEPDLRGARAAPGAVKEAWAEAFNAAAAPLSTVHPEDVHLNVFPSPGGAECAGSGLAGAGCGVLELRVFATDAYEAKVMEMALEASHEAVGAAFEEGLRAAGLRYELVLRGDATAVTEDGHSPVVPSDVKVFKVEGQGVVVISVAAPGRDEAEEVAEALEAVVGGEECQGGGQPWACASRQMAAVAGWEWQPELVGDPEVWVRSDGGGGGGMSKGELGAAVGVTLGLSVALGAAFAWVYAARKRQLGFKWVQFDDVSAIALPGPDGERAEGAAAAV